MQNHVFLAAMRFRLGLHAPREPALRCEGCRQTLDPRGYHRITCNRTARLHSRHRGLVSAWRQVFIEAGGAVPRRNVERLLRDTAVIVPADDARRLDLVVAGLASCRGLSLLCDVFASLLSQVWVELAEVASFTMEELCKLRQNAATKPIAQKWVHRLWHASVHLE